MMDWVVQGAMLADGSGPMDVGIAAGRIAAIAATLPVEAPVIPAGGCLLTPGLVETHVHLDKTCILDRCTAAEGSVAEAVRLTSAAKRSFTPEDVYARGRRTLLAGSVLLMLGDTTFAAFSGSRREALPLRPNDAIYSQALREASEQGFRRFDFGEVPLGNEGLARYKAKWMDESGHLYRYYYPAPPQAEVGAWAASGRAGDLGRAAWRRLPLRTTAVLGDRLYRWF